MKKILILLLLAFSTSMYAQDSIYDMVVKKKPQAKPKNNLELAGIQLQRSAKYQYGAIGFATASVGLFVSSAFMEDKYRYEKGELIKDKNDTRKALLIGGGACALISVFCELYSIDLKMKAGKSIRLYANGNGGGLAYTF